MQPPLQLSIGCILGRLPHSQQALTENLGGGKEERARGGEGVVMIEAGALDEGKGRPMRGRGSWSSLRRRYPRAQERILLCHPPPIPVLTSASHCNSRCPARALPPSPPSHRVPQPPAVTPAALPGRCPGPGEPPRPPPSRHGCDHRPARKRGGRLGRLIWGRKQRCGPSNVWEVYS